MPNKIYLVWEMDGDYEEEYTTVIGTFFQRENAEKMRKDKEKFFKEHKDEFLPDDHPFWYIEEADILDAI